MNLIPIPLYTAILEVLPLLCVDVAIVHQSKYLLVKRKNKPAKEKWWVPGGRVMKGETMEDAVRRKVKEELEIEIKILSVLGYYENMWTKNESDVIGGLHTVSIVFLATPLNMTVSLDNQSSEWKLSKRLPKRFFIKPLTTLL